ncbi:hypothetical protein AJ80_04052 [Polytolypa hystricis UAMH7299]|uniref:Uncharacterized protein n=1 Tax=Polytolypa hystricis (strain UAMH7299) TaxID=1447883 RepID=A0A2B7YDZ1_POLH7|nr:hypothetical protein AJ80_04052 [Polytolypa hystricis UAMH7299]
MGIAGLHGLLKSIQKPCNLKKYKGQTLGVDAYGWLHRGTVACAIDLALGKHNTKYVDFAMNRVRMLLYFGVVPYLVFDGDNLPSKAGTEASRAARREESKRLGLELYRSGRASQAHQELQKAVDVTPYMARLLIEELKKLDIQYVVAPYEADAQLVYLENHGIIDGIISEDSDLLVFGARRLLSKLDQHGDCIEINRSEFSACREVSFVGWSDADFRRMCILSGCDYLASIPKMGLKTAYRSIRKYKTVERVLKMLQFEGNSKIPPDYLENFKRAEHTFLHQRVFCPTDRKLVTLSPLTGDTKLEELTFIGDDFEADLAIGIACGDLDPMTKEPINLKPLYPERARLVPNRRQTLPSADLKPNKSISSFFTPKRVPLGELDPNSLTPSPSQQRLLERQANRSWHARPAPHTSFTASPTPLQAQSVTRSRDDNTARESFLTRAATTSKYQPPKRQRLCSDADEGTLPESVIHERSRFFPASSNKKSCPDKTLTKKARKSGFGVFSDDLAEEIMAQLPDHPNPVTPGPLGGASVSGAPQTASDLAAKEGPVETEARAEDESVGPSKVNTQSSTDDSQSTTVSISKIGMSQLDIASQTEGAADTREGTAVGPDSEPEVFEKLVDYHVKQQNTKLQQKYGYQETGIAKTPQTGGKGVDEETSVRSLGYATPDSKPARLPSVLRPGSEITGSRRASTMRMTPLQRLRQSALSRSKSMDSLPSLISSDQGSTPEDSLVASPSTAASPGVALIHKGSEDLLVPNSDEDEGEDLVEVSAGKPPSLNLDKFLFSATQ